MIKVIIFDADGVLLNQKRFSEDLSKESGVPLEKFTPFFSGPFKDCLVGKADLRDAVLPYLSSWGWDKGVDALLDYWFEREHNLDKDIIAYIQELRARGVLCFLATDNEKHRFVYLLDKLGFSKSFDKTYASSTIGHSKANPEFFAKVFNELDKIDKKEILFIDDDMENIKSAEEFGIHAELYTSVKNLKEKISLLNKN